MTLAIIIATIGTLSIYFVVRYIKSIQEILIVHRVRELILLTTFYYLRQTPDQFVDLSQIQKQSMVKLREYKLKKWVNSLKITWADKDVIEFKYEIDFAAICKRYQFAVGIKEVQKRLEENHTK